MTKRYLKDWAYSKIIDYQLNSKAFGSMALSERRSCARRFEVLPAGSVVALCILNLCEKIAKKMLTELSDYVNIFLACDAHVQCASGSVVEHLLAKEGVAGSIPVSRFFNAKKQHPKRVLFFCIKRAQSWARRFEVSPAGSVVAPAKQGHPQDDRNPSRTFHKKESKRVLFLCFYRAQARDEVDAKASTSYTAQGAVFCIKRA